MTLGTTQFYTSGAPQTIRLLEGAERRGCARGVRGSYVMLGEVVEAMQTVAPVPIERVEAAEAAGRSFHSGV